MTEYEAITGPLDVHLTLRGNIGEALSSYAEEKVREAAKLAPRPVLFARVALTEIDNPSVERPAVAKASLDVSGRPVRAHVAAPTMREAIDELEARLRRRIEVLSEHEEARRQEPGIAEPGEWRHGDLPTARPSYFPRPVEERELVRRKSYALRALDPREAAVEMELLDLDFHLFTNADTGKESVLYRNEGGSLALIETGPVEAVEAATERLDVMDEPFVFFIDSESQRGNVVYRRYDGHYGLITPG